MGVRAVKYQQMSNEFAYRFPKDSTVRDPRYSASSSLITLTSDARNPSHRLRETTTFTPARPAATATSEGYGAQRLIAGNSDIPSSVWRLLATPPTTS